MAEQGKLTYGVDGWPTQRNREVAKSTPEERLLSEALDILCDILMDPDSSRPISLPPITRVALERVRSLIEPVFEVVSDYSHMRIRIEELEAEVEDRDMRLEELEEKLGDDPDREDDDKSTI